MTQTINKNIKYIIWTMNRGADLLEGKEAEIIKIFNDARIKNCEFGNVFHPIEVYNQNNEPLHYKNLDDLIESCKKQLKPNPDEPGKKLTFLSDEIKESLFKSMEIRAEDDDILYSENIKQISRDNEILWKLKNPHKIMHETENNDEYFIPIPIKCLGNLVSIQNGKALPKEIKFRNHGEQLLKNICGDFQFELQHFSRPTENDRKQPYFFSKNLLEEFLEKGIKILPDDALVTIIPQKEWLINRGHRTICTIREQSNTFHVFYHNPYFSNLENSEAPWTRYWEGDLQWPRQKPEKIKKKDDSSKDENKDDSFYRTLKMATNEHVGYYEMLATYKNLTQNKEANNEDNTKYKHIIIAYSQGALVARYLAFLDEYVFQAEDGDGIIAGILTIGGANHGCSFANPDNKDNVSIGLAKILLAGLTLRRNSSFELNLQVKEEIKKKLDLIRVAALFSEGIIKVLEDDIKDIEMKLCKEHRQKSLRASREALLMLEQIRDLKELKSPFVSARKWLSGMVLINENEADLSMTAFHDLGTQNYANSYSVLSLVKENPLNHIYYGALININNQAEYMIPNMPDVLKILGLSFLHKIKMPKSRQRVSLKLQAKTALISLSAFLSYFYFAFSINQLFQNFSPKNMIFLCSLIQFFFALILMGGLTWFSLKSLFQLILSSGNGIISFLVGSTKFLSGYLARFFERVTKTYIETITEYTQIQNRHYYKKHDTKNAKEKQYHTHFNMSQELKEGKLHIPGSAHDFVIPSVCQYLPPHPTNENLRVFIDTTYTNHITGGQQDVNYENVKDMIQALANALPKKKINASSEGGNPKK